MSEKASTPLDLALYIHYPWCVRKCPYCDFSSFGKGADKERDKRYFAALLKDFNLQSEFINGRKFVSVYFGGGTPSLCPPVLMADFLEQLKPYLAENCEISMEANPGTVDRAVFRDFYQAGVNRLSIGVQSFDDRALAKLGRIHRSKEAFSAVEQALKAGFSNINIDLMHALPGQSSDAALADLKKACSLDITHLSWYELTIEEGTVFGRHPPKLPDEDTMVDEEERGFAYLSEQGFERYEVSAFAKNNLKCVHNRNYWLFNDYLGIGAGACGKIFKAGITKRRSCPEDPELYISGDYGKYQSVDINDLPFEYVLNRLRLYGRVEDYEFTKTTALPYECLKKRLESAQNDGLLKLDAHGFELTHLGRRMLNDILELFL